MLLHSQPPGAGHDRPGSRAALPNYDAEELAVVETRIRRINPYARIHRTERCDIDLDEVLDKDAFNLDRILNC
jgi:hypothetical protein